MTSPVDLSIRIFGADILLKHLSALIKEMEGVRSDHADIEYVHRMRVATRRLRAALPLFESSLPARKYNPWRKQIRDLTRALGAARDVDVQIEHLTEFDAAIQDPHDKPGIDRLVLRLRQKRAALQPEVVLSLEKFLASQTAEAMQAALLPLLAQREAVYPFTRALYELSSQAAGKTLEDFLAFDEIVPQPEKILELHQMRIAAKRLRYTLENFASLYSGSLKPWISAVRDAQDTLGLIHDCDVWVIFLPEFLAQEQARILEFYGDTRSYQRLVPGIQQYQAVRQAERDGHFQAFNLDWQRWKADSLWVALQRALQAPLFNQTALYPPPNPAYPDPLDL